MSRILLGNSPRISSCTRTLKRKTSLALVLATIGASSLAPLAHAATPIEWTGATNTTWATGTNWIGGAAPANDLVTNTAVFDQTAYTSAPNAGSTNVAGLVFGNASNSSPAITVTATELRVGSSGVTTNPNQAGLVNIAGAVNIGANQTWNLNSIGGLTIANNVYTDGNNWTVNNQAGTFSIATSVPGLYANGSTLVFNNSSSGTINMTGNNTTTISDNGGAVTFTNTGTGSVTYNAAFVGLGTSVTLSNTGATAFLFTPNGFTTTGTINIDTTNTGIVKVGSLAATGLLTVTNGINLKSGTMQGGITGDIIYAPIVFGSGTSNGTLDIAGMTLTVGSLSVATGATAASQIIGNSSNTAGTLVVDTAFGGSTTFGGTIQNNIGTGTGNTSITKAGTGTLTLTALNTYKGLTTGTRGVIEFVGQPGGSSTQTLGTATGLVGNTTIQSTYGGTGNTVLKFAGTGAFAATGSTGEVSTAASTLTFIINGGTSGATGTNTIVMGTETTVTTPNAKEYIIDNTGAAPAANYAILSPTGSVVIAYTASTPVTAASQFTSITTATGNYNLTPSGTTAFSGFNAVSATVQYTGAAAGTLDLTGGSLTSAGILNAGGGTLNIIETPLARLTGTVAADEGSAAGEIVLYAGTGDISFSAGYNSAVAAQSVTIAGPHNVLFNAITNANATLLTFNGNASSPTGGGVIVIDSSKALDINASGSGGITFNSSITDSPTGPSTVTLDGANTGIISFAGDNTFTGGLIINPGAQLKLAGNAPFALGAGTITINGGTIGSFTASSHSQLTNNPIIIKGDFTLGYANLNGISLGNGPVTLTQSVTITDNNSAATNVTDTMTAPNDNGLGFSITKAGTGFLTLVSNGVDLIGGSYTITAGTLSLSSSEFATSRNNVINIGPSGTFLFGSTFAYVAGITGSGILGADTSNRSPSLGGQGSYVFSGTIASTAAAFNLIKSGTGTQTFSGAESNGNAAGTEQVVVNSGTLILDFSGPVSTASTTPGQDVLFHQNGVAITPGTLALGGGTLQLNGLAGAANSQHFNTISVTGGASHIVLNAPATNTVALLAGNLTNSVGATVDFAPPAGAPTLASGVSTTTINPTNGILGGFATVNNGSDWAVSSATANPGVIINATASASPYVLTMPASGAAPANGDVVLLSVAPGLTNLSANVPYYVINSTGVGGTFQVALLANSATAIAAAATVTNNTTGTLNVGGNIIPLASYAPLATAGVNDNATLTDSGALTANTTVNSLKIGATTTGQVLDLAGFRLGISTTTQNVATINGGLLFNGTSPYAISSSVAGGTLTADTNVPITIAVSATPFIPIPTTQIIIQQYGAPLTISVPIINGSGFVTNNNDTTPTATLTQGYSSFTKSGPGTLILTGANTWSGATFLNQGVTQVNSVVGNATALGATTAANSIADPTQVPTALVFNGGTLQYAPGYTADNGDITLRSVSINAGGTVIDTNGNNITFTNPGAGLGPNNPAAGAITTPGVFGGKTPIGGLTKTGAGTLTLTGISTYQGPTIIKGGILSIGSGANVAESDQNGTISTSGAPGIQDVNTAGLVIGQEITGNGVVPGNYILGFNPTDPLHQIIPAAGTNSNGQTALTFASFTPLNNGGPNYSSSIGVSTPAAENLVLDGGTLQYTGVTTSTNRLFTVTTNNGGLDASGSGTVTFSNTAPIVFTGSATLTLTGTNTGGNTLDPLISDAVANSNPTSALTTAGVTALAKSGAGTWILTAPNTYSGGTTITAGTLLADNTTGSATGTGNVTLTGGTLGGSGIITGNVNASTGTQTIAPSVSLPANSTSTLTLGGLTTNPTTTLAFNIVSPAITTPTAVASVNDHIVTGSGGLTLTGGILVIHNAATNVGLPSLGYYKAIQYTGTIASTGYTTVTLPAPTLLSTGPGEIVYTLDPAHDPGFLDIHRGLLGDANDDGIVNFADFIRLSNNFGDSDVGWFGGDFNGDGITNFADFILLSNNFGDVIDGSSDMSEAEIAEFKQDTASFGSPTSVPEPASLALMGLGAAILLKRRRKN